MKEVLRKKKKRNNVVPLLHFSTNLWEFTIFLLKFPFVLFKEFIKISYIL